MLAKKKRQLSIVIVLTAMMMLAALLFSSMPALAEETGLEGTEHLQAADGVFGNNGSGLRSGAGDLIGSNRVTMIEDVITDSDGKETLKTYVRVKSKTASDDNVFEYKTGQSAKYNIAISNEDNTTMTKNVRVYFAYDGDGQAMGTFPVGDYLLRHEDTAYPMKVVETDVPNVFYYEITGIGDGETLSFDNSVAYPSPGTPGGTLRIWTKTITSEESEELEGKVISPTGMDYLELKWDTDPITYNIGKTNSSVYSNQTASISVKENGEAPVTNLAWLVTESNASGSSSSSEGQDHILRVDYADIIDIPDTLVWREEVLAVLESGVQSSSSSTENGWWTQSVSAAIDTSSSTTCNTIRVRANGKVYDVVYINKKTSGNASGIMSFTPEIVTVDGKKKLKLTWYCTNSSTVSGDSRSAEYGVQNFYLRVGNDVLLADIDAVNEAYEADPSNINSLIEVKNDASEVRHYSYSPDQSAAAQTAIRTVKVDTGWNVTKNWQVSPTSSRGVYGGNDDFSTITISDTGILPISKWGTESNPGRIVLDTLDSHFYITPENIANMLNATTTVGSGDSAKTVPLGDWLTITINHASLFDPHYFQATEGADQTGKYSTNNIAALSDTNAHVFESATFTITKDERGRIVVTLAGDMTDSNNRSYVIGTDYDTLQELFDALGYFPTRNTTYTLEYVVKDEFVLRPGQKLNVPILETCKTTPMMLTVDTRKYYTYNTSTQYTNNTATVNATVGGTVRTANPRTPRNSNGYDYHYWSSELYVSKSATSESGTSYSSGNAVPEGTVLSNRINGYNYGNYKYDTMQFADYMYGAEVLLVPKNENPDLASAGLGTFESNGVSYWLMNKPGTYSNVIVGSTTRNGAQTYKATTIQVTKSGSGTSGSLNTLIKWEPIENWHTTGTGSYKGYTDIYYKSIASAYWAGLVDSSGTSSGEIYNLANKAWLGDHQGHRLWDTYGLYYNSFRFDGKNIVENDGTLSKSSRIKNSKNGETVTYQVSISNITSTPVTITGNMLRDALPNTYGTFEWAKDVNVKNLRYIAPEGSTITVGGTSLDISGGANSNNDYWNVVSSTKAPTRYATGTNAYQGGWDIVWDSTFQVKLAGNGTLKILVDLTYPARADGDTWDHYVSATKGNPIYNYFYFLDSPSYVSHTLEAKGRPVLYKGVYDTGLTTHRSGANYTSTQYGSYSSNNSRLRYVNNGGPVSYTDADLKAETITYYTILYNGSYDRLYLSDMQDILPRGFTFNSFCNTTSTTSYLTGTSGNYTSKNSTQYSYNYLGFTGNQQYYASSGSYTVYKTLTEGYSSSNKLVTISNAASSVDNNTIRYTNAAITAVTSMGDDGRQHVTYSFGSASAGYGNSAIHYDSVAKKYYLNPGEAIRFGYNCLVDSYAKTDDLATNTIAMPYYDYYGIGFDLHAPSDKDGGAKQTVAARTGISKNNDGGCELMDDDEVSALGISTEGYQGDAYHTHDDGNWLVSDVTVERAPMTPGIIKTVGGTSLKPSDSSTAYGSLGTTNTAMNGGTASRFGTAYKYSCSSSEIINWRLRVYNEAGGSDDDIAGMMSNYKVVDTVAGPFGFTGRVFYNMFRDSASTSSPSTSASQYLFVLGRRTEGDTSVRIGTGTSLSNNGYTLTIGSTEDDQDDWYTFNGGTTKEGRVKIERDADGKEVMTIELTGSTYAIPGGCYMELAVHTQFNKDKDVAISEGKYNDVVLYPTQGYDPAKVAQGRARTKQEYDHFGNLVTVNDGVQSGASVMLVQGYSSSSWKTVTKSTDTSVVASSEDSGYISLDERHDSFRYDLFVVGPEDIMAKIVLIDALPQEGDHSAFVIDDKRYSDFTVGIDADNPEFKVALAPDGGSESELDSSRYSIYVNERTEFGKEDWKGNGEGWIDISELSGDDLTAALESARSLRLIIKDPDAYRELEHFSDYMMAGKSRVHFSFNAKVTDPEAKPGEYAWNSFGYTYSVPMTQNGTEENSSSQSLNAQPDRVGVRFPAAPTLEKQIVELGQKMVEKTEQVEVETDVQKVDENGELVFDDEGNPVYETELVTRVVTEMVEHQVYDSAGNPLYNDDGTPVTEMVEEPVMVPATQPVLDDEGNQVMDEDGNPVTEPVMETRLRTASKDLTFGFIVYKGERILELDNALDMDIAEIAQILESEDRTYLYVPLNIAEGSSSAKAELWKYEYQSRYDADSNKFIYTGPTDDGAEPDWLWENAAQYTVIELPLGDYNYELRSIKVNDRTFENNNVTFQDNIASVVTLLASNEWTPEYLDITGKKVWNDNNNQDGARPEQITVRLLADGEEVDVRTVTAKDNWSFSFEHLLKNHETGDDVVYQIIEDSVSGYNTTVTTASDNPCFFTVTNSHEPGKRSVQVVKMWSDMGNYDALRPDSVVVHLWADGKDTGKTLSLSKENNWQGSFTSLDEFAGGKKIEYTVSEDTVAGYSTSIKGSADKGYVVTNSHTPIIREDTPDNPDQADNPGKTKRHRTRVPGLGDFAVFAIAGGLFVAAYISLIIVSMRRRKQGR